MLVVKFEVWPDGDEAHARTVGQIRIHATGDPAEQCGSYDVEVSPCSSDFRKGGNWRTGQVRGFLKHMTVYHLLTLALQACRIFPEEAA